MAMDVKFSIRWEKVYIDQRWRRWECHLSAGQELGQLVLSLICLVSQTGGNPTYNLPNPSTFPRSPPNPPQRPMLIPSTVDVGWTKRILIVPPPKWSGNMAQSVVNVEPVWFPDWLETGSGTWLLIWNQMNLQMAEHQVLSSTFIFISPPDLKNGLVQTCQEKNWLKVPTISSSSHLQPSRLQLGWDLLLAPPERGSNLDAPPLDQGGGEGRPAACVPLDAPSVGKRWAWRQHCLLYVMR